MSYKSNLKWLTQNFFDNNSSRAEEFTQSFFNLVKIGDDFDKRFHKKRLEFLSICNENKNKFERWEKVKDYLVNNISDLIYIPHVYKNNKKLLIEYIIESNSIINDCLRFLVICNALDVEYKLPKEVCIYKNGNYIPDWELKTNVTRFQIKLKNNNVIIYDIPKDNLYNNYYVDIVRFRSNKEIFIIKQSKLFDEFKARFRNITKSNKINSKTPPSHYLKIIKDDVRYQFLSKLFKKKGSWKVEDENKKEYDYEKVFLNASISPKNISELSIEDLPTYISTNTLLNNESLSFELLDYYLNQNNELVNQNMIFRIAKSIGYKIFYSKNISNFILNYSEMNKTNILNKLDLIFQDYYEIHNPDTKERYLKIHNTVDHYSQLGFKKQDIYKKLGTRLKMKKSSIETRYKEMSQLSVKQKYKNQNLEKIYGFYFIQ